jgi:hypothetical protein
MWDFPEYGSHLPVICRVFTELKNSTGAVLELGCGDFSTALLHELCVDRLLASLDADKAWVEKFVYLANKHHVISHVTSWENLGAYDMFWDIVLVDQAPGEFRRTSIEKLANKAKIIIAHDTETPGNIYGYQHCLDKFKYFTEYKGHYVTTAVVSNFIDCTRWWE